MAGGKQQGSCHASPEGLVRGKRLALEPGGDAEKKTLVLRVKLTAAPGAFLHGVS
jgi:hypothetical protein